MNNFISFTDGLENGPMKSLFENLDAAGRARFTALMTDIVQGGVAEQGKYALGSEREDAAAHEAGHVILGAAVGFELRSTRIHRAKLDPHFIAATGIKTFWAGFTDSGDGMAIAPDSDTASDLVHAANILAGFMAEVHLLRERVRAGSSAAERTTALMIADNIAAKTGDDPQALMLDVLLFLRTLFIENDKSLCAVARVLERDRSISGDKLKVLVGDVRPVTTITLACPRFGKPITPQATKLRV